MDWYFTVTSAEYEAEDYGPYDTEEDAIRGITRIRARAATLNDGIDRQYGLPHYRRLMREWSE